MSSMRRDGRTPNDLARSHTVTNRRATCVEGTNAKSPFTKHDCIAIDRQVRCGYWLLHIARLKDSRQAGGSPPAKHHAVFMSCIAPALSGPLPAFRPLSECRPAPACAMCCSRL